MSKIEALRTKPDAVAPQVFKRATLLIAAGKLVTALWPETHRARGSLQTTTAGFSTTAAGR